MPLSDDAADDCVRQGVFFGIQPHYLMAATLLRSRLQSDPSRIDPYKLTQAEWDANKDDDETDTHFTSAQINSPVRQCVVFALWASRAFKSFLSSSGHPPTVEELYLLQFPGASSDGLAAALTETAAQVAPASERVLDDPPKPDVSDGPDSDVSGPPVITADPVPNMPPAGPGMVTLQMLQRRWPRASAALIEGMASNANVLTQLQIDNPLRMAHFMAQITQESGGGTEITENLNYSAERMMEVFPRRFPTLASTVGFARNERAFGDKVYNGRMGNRVNTDDGFNFRGRGCLQLTGRNSYDALGRSLGLDLVNNPDLVNAPQHVLLIAGTEFVKLGCLIECDRDDVVQVSARINLGHPTSTPGAINGLPERRRQLGIWKQEFGAA